MADDDGLPGAVRSVGDGFWNVRGSFRLGPVDLGTQASLVRLADGRFVWLDAYDLDDETRRWAAEVVGPAGVAAILNLHPFHTLHVRAMAAAFPGAKLYGTARHHARFPDLRWEPERTEDPALHARFADDLAFTVPRGVDFVPANENLHFASVLALHRATRVLHVDDTLLYVRLPGLLRRWKPDVVRLHPTLRRVLEPRPGAAADFRAWCDELRALARQADTLCAAHSGVLPPGRGAPLAERVDAAIDAVASVVDRHEKRHG